MAPDEPLSLRSLDSRVRKIEARDIEADIVHAQLLHADSQTAEAVRRLSDTINDPRNGLIVELERFREEVRTDRRIMKAYISGGVAVISVIYAIVTLLAPAIRSALGLPQF